MNENEIKTTTETFSSILTERMYSRTSIPVLFDELADGIRTIFKKHLDNVYSLIPQKLIKDIKEGKAGWHVGYTADTDMFYLEIGGYVARISDFLANQVPLKKLEFKKVGTNRFSSQKD